MSANLGRSVSGVRPFLAFGSIALGFLAVLLQISRQVDVQASPSEALQGREGAYKESPRATLTDRHRTVLAASQPRLARGQHGPMTVGQGRARRLLVGSFPALQGLRRAGLNIHLAADLQQHRQKTQRDRTEREEWANARDRAAEVRAHGRASIEGPSTESREPANPAAACWPDACS